MDSLDGKIAVITGGASGIGRAIALELAGRGADVAIADVHSERLATTVTELDAIGRGALGVRCDVTSDADVEDLRDQAFARFGQVDILCNNAG